MSNRFVVTNQYYVEDVDAGIDISGRKTADSAFTCTGAGTFKIHVAAGCTGTVSGTNVQGTPVTLVEGENTITTTGAVADGNIDITIAASTTVNWSDIDVWAETSGGKCGYSVPVAADPMAADSNSFPAANTTLTIDATAYCLSMDWTGATNTPTFAGSQQISIYGDLTLINDMNWTQSNNVNVAGAENVSWTFAGKTLSYLASATSFTGKLTFVDALTLSAYMDWNAGTLDTNGQTFAMTGFRVLGTNTKTLTLGNSTINCTYVENTASGAGIPTFTANTATISISGTGVVSLGNANWNGASFNLTGTSHTVSGSPTGIATFTRTGTATTTDSVTFTSGDNLTCGTFAMIGNSITNRLLVQSSTLGTAATITATNWIGSANVDIMDITVTNPVDLSAITGGSGDCQGNTDITFTTAAAQISAATGNWSSLATWQDGAGTDRVPLPQDDVTCSHSVTVDMPRIGKSITFTGTPTVILSQEISIYGSLVKVVGMNLSGNYFTYMRGRGDYLLYEAGKGVNAEFRIACPTGKVTLMDSTTSNTALVILAGTFDFNDQSPIMSWFWANGSLVGSVYWGNGVITFQNAGVSKFNHGNSNIINYAENSSIVLTNSGVNAQTFAGGGFTYNNVIVQGAGAYTLTVTGNNTFNEFKVDASLADKTIKFTDGTTQTINDTVLEAGVNTITLNKTSTGANPAINTPYYRADGDIVITDVDITIGGVYEDISGTANTKPLMELTANADLGTITVEIESKTTRQVFTWTGELNTDDVLLIDCENQYVTVNGVSAMSGLDGTEEFIELQPGVNRMLVGAFTGNFKLTYHERFV